MIEFALVMPFMIFAIMGGMELTWQAIVRQKIQGIAATAADNTARIRGVIDETDITETMTAATINGSGLDLDKNGRMIISSIQRNSANNGDWIRWQRCYGEKNVDSKYGNENAGKNTATTIGLNNDPNMRPPAGNAMIVVEITYDHEPLITETFFGEKTFTYETAYIVRDRADLGIRNVTNLSGSKRFTC